MAQAHLNALTVPWQVAAVIVVGLILAPSLFVSRLQIDNAPEVYLPANMPALQFEQALRERFAPDEFLIAAFAGDDLLEDDFLGRLETLVENMQNHALVDRIMAPSTVDHLRSLDGELILEPLLAQLTWRELDIEQRRDRLLSSRLFSGLLFSEDVGVMAVAVRPFSLHDSRQRLLLYQDFLTETRAAGLDKHLRAVTGQVVLDAHQLQITIRDCLVLIPATVLTGLLLLMWMFRRILAAISFLAIVSASVGCGLLVVVLLGQPFTLITAALPPLITALSTALLVHWLNALAFAQRHGLSGHEQVMQAWHYIRRPALYTALTTAAGLLSLTISQIQPIRTLGLASAVAVMVQYLIVIWLLPSIFVRWDRGEWTGARLGMRFLDRLVSEGRSLSLRHPGKVLLATALLLAATAPAIWHVEVESDFARFFKPDHPLLKSTDFVRQHLAGPALLQVVLSTSDQDAFIAPERLQRLALFRTWAEQRPEVSRASTAVEFLEELNWVFHDQAPDQRVLPDEADRIAQYLLIYDGTDLYELIDREYAVTRVILNLDIQGSSAVKSLLDDIDLHFADLGNSDIEVQTAGAMRLFVDFERLLLQGQLQGLSVAVVLIALLLALLWRSPSAAGVCMIPNLSPLVVIFILMGFFGIWLDLATAMVASVAVGVAVDDTVHFYHAYRDRLSRGASRTWALARAYQRAGRAITATTLILCAQFLVMANSAFVPTVNFGLLTAAGLLMAWLFDLLVLPALLILGKAATGQK